MIINILIVIYNSEAMELAAFDFAAPSEDRLQNGFLFVPPDALR